MNLPPRRSLWDPPCDGRHQDRLRQPAASQPAATDQGHRHGPGAAGADGAAGGCGDWGDAGGRGVAGGDGAPQALGPGETGELVVRGPHCMLGYRWAGRGYGRV